MNRKIKIFIFNIWNGLKSFVKRFGIDALLALIVWTSPSWLSFFIPSFEDFALIWLGLVVSPIVPSWFFVPVIAVFIHWLRKQIWKSILFIRDQIDKIRLQNTFMAYFTRDEMKLIERIGKELYKDSQKRKEEFVKVDKELRKKKLLGEWNKK